MQQALHDSQVALDFAGILYQRLKLCLNGKVRLFGVSWRTHHGKGRNRSGYTGEKPTRYK